MFTIINQLFRFHYFSVALSSLGMFISVRCFSSLVGLILTIPAIRLDFYTSFHAERDYSGTLHIVREHSTRAANKRRNENQISQPHQMFLVCVIVLRV